jgi:hypothetical protein
MCASCGVVYCECPDGGEHIYYTSSDLARARGFDVLDNEVYDQADYCTQEELEKMKSQEAAVDISEPPVDMKPIEDVGGEITNDDLPF